MNIDVSPAFEKGNKGLTIWITQEGQYQVSIKNSHDAWNIGVGDTIHDAMRAALGTNTANKPKRRRDMDDLA